MRNERIDRLRGVARLIPAGVAVCGLMLWLCGTASAETWSGGAAPDPGWGNAANWGGDALEEPESHNINFGNAGAGTNALDQNRTLNAGLTVTNTAGLHTMDLGGNTLTLAGGTLSVGNGVVGSAATFTNGTLAVGTTNMAGTLWVGYGGGGPSGSLAIASGFIGNLNEVDVGYATAYATTKGTLDLRGATSVRSLIGGSTVNNTLAVTNLNIGGNGDYFGTGYH